MQLTEITQREYEAYSDRLTETRNAPGFDDMSPARYNRQVIEAARDAGFARELPDDLLSMQPWQIVEWTVAIIAHVTEATRPPSEGE